MKRRKTRQVKIGKIKIGGNAPISIQSMTKTDTKDIDATAKQIKSLEKAGCEIIRVAVKGLDSAKAIAKIKKRIKIPIVADIHFDYRMALEAVESGSDAIRLNPGNIYRPKEVKEVIAACKKRKIPIRIGANSGSIRASKKQLQSKPQSALMVKNITNYLKLFEKEKFYDIIISLKAADVPETIEAYRAMAKSCIYPFHLGITATGSGNESIVKSAIGIGTLLAEGIGDTIRVSLTSASEDEVIVGRDILQALGLRRFGPEVISCPACGRCQVDLAKLVKEAKEKLTTNDYRLKTKHSPTIAIMGCEVNGPGEAKHADIGIAFGKGQGVVFKKGRPVKKVKSKDAIKELLKG